MNLRTKSFRLFLLLLAIASFSASALSPLTPSFNEPTYARITQQLKQAQVPSVGHSSVFLAIEAALGYEPRSTSFEYNENYPHLPTVSVVSSRIQETPCVSIAAVVQGAADAGYSTVLVSGNFCMVGRAQWSSSDVVARRVGVR